MVGVSWLRLFSVASLAMLLMGGLGVYFSDRADYCIMTYMFEYPQFVRIMVPDNEKYPQYGLYSYSEGRLTERARKMRFDGIPILFLPGNSGSHMQARSLASVALRKAISKEYDFHFDFFTISYNEELSGLYGGVLERQTEFTALALQRILSLYSINKHMQSIPESVVIIGHSMGGVIAKRLLAYPQTENLTNVAITLAAPIAAPLVNFDISMDRYYLKMKEEWDSTSQRRSKKVLISFGGGPKDLMVPASLISSEYADMSVMTTAVPGVWTSTNHLSIVWCKQFVLTVNRFLFSIVNATTNQVVTDKNTVMARAHRYFKANRSMSLNQDIPRASSSLVADAFWYEDNRRVYQISRPEITRMTYLMIRLVGFHQERFAAIESVNLEDRVWVYGCNAAFTHGNHRICKNGTSLAELTRWTGAAGEAGRRRLATLHLHDLMMQEPEWTHVVVKISPTKKPITLNVDINDHASRHITVDLPFEYSYGRTVLVEETEPKALYYELTLPDMYSLHHTYLLYVEPSASCKATQYHASAEMHVPWAENYEYFHYFTQLKKTPMKLRLFASHPNATNDKDVSEHVKVTVLLDPQCTFSISIAPSRYHMLAQLSRQHYPILLPYMAAIFLLAARSSLLSMASGGGSQSLHAALASEGARPYYAIVFGRLGTMVVATVPVLAYVLDTTHVGNGELRHLSRSLLSVPAYLAALGAANALSAAALAALLCSSQLAHRLLLRIVCRGGGGGGGAVAERLAAALRRAPALASAALACGAPASCGAASLAAGAAFYFFMLSKMYEEYLEDYAYKLLAKVGAKVRSYFKSGKKQPSEANNESLSLLNAKSENSTAKAIEYEDDNIRDEEKVATENALMVVRDKHKLNEDINISKTHPVKAIENTNDNMKDDREVAKENTLVVKYKDEINENTNTSNITESDKLVIRQNDQSSELNENEEGDNIEATTDGEMKKVDKQLNSLNFHLIMFFLWGLVTLANLPALLTWARNFKYNMVLKPDTSFYPGVVMSVCAGFVWQMDGPRRNLKYYELLSQIIFALAIILVVMGPMASYYISYTVTAAFALITLQQLFDTELPVDISVPDGPQDEHCDTNSAESRDPEDSVGRATDKVEDRIYETLKNAKEKIEFGDELLES